MNKLLNEIEIDNIKEFHLIAKEESDYEQVEKKFKLSENFIRNHHQNMDWASISIYQKLSQEFIREFQHKVNWCCISLYQELSYKFIVSNISKINIDNLYKNEKITLTLEEKKQIEKIISIKYMF